MTKRFLGFYVALAITCSGLATSSAAPRTVSLGPATAQFMLTIRIFGLFAVPAHFNDFNGQLTYDPASPGTCSVHIDVSAGSLQMADEGRARLARGPNLLDAAAYPTLHYIGSCAGESATGQLTLHGITRPVMLKVVRDGSKVEASGSIRRQDFGVNGLPGVIGQTIKVTFSADITK